MLLFTRYNNATAFPFIRQWLVFPSIVLLMFLIGGCEQEVANAILVKGYMNELVERWAPIHTQDVDQDGTWSLKGRSDYITAVDFDGDWNTTNNWENIAPRFGFEAVAHGYYSLVLSETHAFIIYAFYHPRDWNQSGIKSDAHENDMEGLLTVVELPGRLGSDGFDYSNYGILKAIVTVFHCDFYSYNNRSLPEAERFTENEESMDGKIRFEEYNGGSHPQTAQEAHGHGLKAWPDVDINGGDGIVYYPTFSTPSEPDGPNDRRAQYLLVDIFAEGGLWERRSNTETFASFGTFFGDTHEKNAAHAPWGWDDNASGICSYSDADNVGSGVIATDPIILVESYFQNPGNFSETYIYNPYQGINFVWP